MKLTKKQSRFVDYYIEYHGDGTKAAIAAGYSKDSARYIASENLTKPHIVAAIDEVNDEIRNDRIADMQEVSAFWTEVMRDEEQHMGQRIKASEHIARSNAAFIDRVDNTGDIELKIEWLED